MVDDKGPMIIAVCWTFTALGLIFVGGRLFVRATVHRKLFSDDYWIILSSACAILSNALVTISVGWGNGKRFTVLDLEQKQNTVKWMIAAYVPGIETLGFPKLAVIALLTRLLAPGKLHLRVLWSMGIICCLSLTAMVLTLLLQCTPPRALWTFSLPRNCLDPKVLEGLAFWASSFSAFLDFYLAVYPAVVLWKLQMRFQKKLALTCALGMGIISGCAGIVKATGVPTLSSQDVSYDLCDPLYWTSIEGNLIIIAACIPILQPILEMFKGRGIWSLDKKSGSYQYNSHSKKSAHHQQQQPQQDSIELRSKPRKKVDVYGFTMHAKEDSEESIVNPGKNAETSSSGRQSDTYPESEDKIVKSSTVTITYDQGEEGPTSAATRWAAI
ncbi:hypothetical protein HER10_EVM0007803 [Colletotrichum scovillei]|uniref:Integral membrane protein n=1 Tax=Colletotrichum scovillei TaxID=1209932 RepID=A0A9P7QVF4_9PEZI|nr:uncharacterized protein HER10_EVM0007803 [Colletotrichum scovillei]KAF4775205.1 hypothetical protein HER10_EVM0007803 [Colletotrichum scovillei]KAG7042817.1 integral membrane protein [Colletotrichum scovillei]KAG7043409.1 integral membrane protein [Colletotrichum scovillei]KAG7062861.1 integral membrane protein [Colletotrichum scovillei]